MEVSPKVKHVLWRLCSNSLLKHRHMLDDAACPWCVAKDETSAHTLVHCTRVLELWCDSGCKQLVDNIGESWW